MSFRSLLEVFAIRPDSCTTDQFGSSKARGAGPVPLSVHIGGGGRIQRSPRIGPRIPITSRQEERHEATIRTPAHEAEILEILITPN